MRCLIICCLLLVGCSTAPERPVQVEKPLKVNDGCPKCKQDLEFQSFKEVVDSNGKVDGIATYRCSDCEIIYTYVNRELQGGVSDF